MCITLAQIRRTDEFIAQISPSNDPPEIVDIPKSKTVDRTDSLMLQTRSAIPSRLYGPAEAIVTAEPRRWLMR